MGIDITCRSCGRQTPASSFCAHCGERLPGGTPLPDSGAAAVVAPALAAFQNPNSPAAATIATAGPRVTAAMQPQTGPLTPGQAFGSRYHLIKLLGVGGMGAVYQAWDQELSVAVALKTIRADSIDAGETEDIERRFKRELLLARQVTHKNVVRIHDLGEVDGIKYITMPFIDGPDLRQVLEKVGRMPVSAALNLMRQVVAGVQAAHEAGVVHRDLKPANIMVEGDRAIVTDFGIAHPTSGATIAATMAGSITGTLEYMAPEQARGEEVDARADVYALGLILYDMLLGPRRGAAGTSAVSELMARMTQPPRAPREIDPQFPEAVERIILKCVAPDRTARYASAAELGADLALLDPLGRAPDNRERRRHRQVIWAAAALIIAALVGTAGWSAFERMRTPAVVAARPPVSVLIADFRNTTGEPVFDGSLEPLLTLSLEGASFITSYPRNGAQRLLQQISPASPALDERGAQLVSRREGINLVLSGTVAKVGERYRVSVRSMNSDDGSVVAESTASALTKQEVLAAVTAVSADIRKALGDASPREAMLNETFTAANIEAAHDYSQAQSLALAGKNEEAIQYYRQAVERDPSFGRAYSGWAVSAARLGREEEAETLWKKALSLLNRMTPREKYRTLGGYYMTVSRDYPQAIENYRTLVRLFPSDGAGLNSLGVAYFNSLDFRSALEQGKHALTVYPKNALYRTNYALYAMYAGDFGTATEQANVVIRDHATLYKPYLPLAMAAQIAGRPQEAEAAYSRMAAVDPAGASLAVMGLADMAMASGDFRKAEELLRRGLAGDTAARSTSAAATKQVALAEALLAQGGGAAAIEEAEAAIRQSQAESIGVVAARVFIGAGRAADARRLSETFAGRLQKRSRAYGKLIEAEIALSRGKPAEALDLLRAAQALADLWLVHEALGRTYLAAGQPAQALGEFETCEKRIGEATAVFLDDIPTFRVAVASRSALQQAKRATSGMAAQSPAP